MRDFQLQTAQRDQTSANHRPKTANIPRKAVKKSLNPEFKAFPEDDSVVLVSMKKFSEASDDSVFSESTENFLTSVNASETHSSENFAVSDLTSTLSSTSVTATPYKHVTSDTGNTKSPEVDSYKMTTSVEAEVVIKHLREARIQVFKSKDVGSSKKLVVALIDVIIKEFHGGHVFKENEWVDKLLSRNSNLVILISIMVMFSVLMVWIIDWSRKESFTGPTPT